MQWSLLPTLLHVAVAVIFIAGLIGRWILLTRAARAETVETAFFLSQNAAPFERLVISFSQNGSVDLAMRSLLSPSEFSSGMPLP